MAGRRADLMLDSNVGTPATSRPSRNPGNDQPPGRLDAEFKHGPPPPRLKRGFLPSKWGGGVIWVFAGTRENKILNFNKLKPTCLTIETIKVTDYNAAVEAMRAGRAHIAWYGGKTYVKAAEIAQAEAFAAGVRPGEKDAGYYTYFVVKQDSELKKFTDVKGKILSLNTIGSTSGDLIPQVELSKINLSIKNKDHFENVFYAGSHDACLLAVINNQSDVCGMSSRNFEARLEDGTFKKEDVRIIHKSDRVPPPPLAYSKMIPKEDRDKIKKAVLDAHNHGAVSYTHLRAHET